MHCGLIILLLLLLPARLMGQYCFARWRLSSSVVVSNAAGGRAGGPAAKRVGGQPPPVGCVAVERPTLHGRPVRLRPVRATPC